VTSLKCLLISLITQLCAAIDKVNDAIETITEMIDKLCSDDCPPASKFPCKASANGDEGGEATWLTGPSAGATMTYPTPILESVADWRTTISATEEDLLDCCAEHTPESAVTVRFNMEHKLIGERHTGFVLSTGAGQFTAKSANNTSSLASSLPSSTVGVGMASGSEDDDFVERWVEITLSCKELLAGFEVKSFAFEGGGTGEYDEQLNGLSAEIVAVEGC